MYQDKIQTYFNDPTVEQALVEAVSRLVAIRSVREEPQEGMPFGAGPARALAEGLALAKEMGFVTENHQGYVGSADMNDGETQLHILGHLDVVGEGTGWTVTEPYTPKLVDDMLYGRGTNDDKGPVVAALFAMKAVKDMGVPLTKNVRLLMGTDEESGSSDIAHYYATHPYAPCTFSPDAEFPVINIEKGSYQPAFLKKWEREEATPCVTALEGGFRINVLPGDAKATVVGMDEIALQPYWDAISSQTGVTFTMEEGEGGITIHCHGKGAHASMPEMGNNAITGLLTLLDSLPLAKTASAAAIASLHTIFPHGDDRGAGLGIAQSDEVSGDLTLALTLLTMTETGVQGQFDSRVPICANEENCKKVAEATFAKFGFSAEGGMRPAHHTPAESPFVQTLLKCYEQYTGEKGECLAIGGGTYVHDIPNGVAYGCGMPGFNGNMHGADEHVSVQDLMTSCKIFAQAIIDICG